MSAHIDISNPRDAAILVSALLAQCANERFRAEGAEQAQRNAEISRDRAWNEAGAATSTIIEMRGQLEAAEQRAREASSRDATMLWPPLRSALSQLISRIRGRGDAGHLLGDVERVEAILKGIER